MFTNPTKLAEMTAKVVIAMANNKCVKPMTPSELKAVFSAPMQTLAPALQILRWTRHYRWPTKNNKRIVLTYWVPPNSSPPPKGQRGRPSYAQILSEIL